MAEYYQNLRSPTLRDIVRALGALLGVMIIVSVTWSRWLLHQDIGELTPDAEYRTMYWVDAAQIFAFGIFLLIPYHFTRRHKITRIIFCWLIGHYAATMTIQVFRATDLEKAATAQYLITALIALAQAYLLLRAPRPQAATPVPANEAPPTP